MPSIPLRLKSTYLLAYEPASLEKPYGLKSTYEEGDPFGDKYVSPPSIDLLEIDSHLIYNSLQIANAHNGFSLLTYGQHLAYNSDQHIKVNGLPPSLAIGVPKVINLNQWRALPSIAPNNKYGQQLIYNYNIPLVVGDKDSLALGQQLIRDKTTYLVLEGIDSLSLGTQKIFNSLQLLSLTGIDSFVSGNSLIRDRAYFIGLQGASFAAIGGAKLHNALQITRAISFDALGTGLQNIDHLHRGISLIGLDALSLSWHEIKDGTIYPTEVTGKGFDSFVSGEPVMVFDRFIYATGLDSAQYLTTIVPPVAEIFTQGINSLEASNEHWLMKDPHDITPTWDAADNKYGQHNIARLLEYIEPIGIPAITEFRSIHLVYDTLIVMQVVGIVPPITRNVGTIENAARSFTPAGLDSLVADGAGLVSHYTRTYELEGFDWSDYGIHYIRDKSSWIEAGDYDFFSAGSAGIKNRNRHITFYGIPWFESGDALIKNRNVSVRPAGINSSAYGTTRVRNEREYVKDVVGVSTFQSGTAELFDRAFYPRPKGFDLLSYGVASVSNYSRFLDVDTLWPPHLTDNHAIDFKDKVLYQGRGIEPPTLDLEELQQFEDDKAMEEGADPDFVYVPTAIKNLRRYYHLSPINNLAIGAIDIDFVHRERILLGLHSSKYGTHTVSDGTIYPSRIAHWTIESLAIGTVTFSYTQEIALEGFDSVRYLDRVVPDGQIAQAHGRDSFEVGYNSVMGNPHELFPRWYSIENFRYGNATIEHLLHIVEPQSILPLHTYKSIQLVYDTLIKMEVVGIVPPITNNVGLVENAAKHCVVREHDSLVVGGAEAVTHSVRNVAPETIPPFPVGKYQAIYNAAYQILMPSLGDNFKSDWFNVIDPTQFTKFTGAGEVTYFGTAYIDYGVRALGVKSIQPPYADVFTVEYYTREIQQKGYDWMAAGYRSDVHEVFRHITPRWNHRDYFGLPTLHNATPTVYQKPSMLLMELGAHTVDYYTRSVTPTHFDSMNLTNGNLIRDRRSLIFPTGVPAPQVTNRHGVNNATKDADIPFSEQRIIVSPFNKNDDKDEEGLLMGLPSTNIKAVFLYGLNSFAVGEHDAWSGIVEPKTFITFAAGQARISTWVGNVYPASIEPPMKAGEGDSPVGQTTRHRVSPFTIYPTATLPDKPNGPPKGVSSDGEYFSPSGDRNNPNALRMGYHEIENTLKPPKPPVRLGGIDLNFRGIPRVQNRLGLINFLDSPFMFRAGWQEVLAAGVARGVDLDELSPSLMALGNQRIARINNYKGSYTTKPNGIGSFAAGLPMVDYYNRYVEPEGVSILAMGASQPNERPYMYQRFAVHFPVKNVQVGFDTLEISEYHWVSLGIRDCKLVGFDSMFMQGYDSSNFEYRMRLVRMPPKYDKTTQLIEPPASDTLSRCGIPNIINHTHHIHPIGNSEQFRKSSVTEH